MHLTEDRTARIYVAGHRGLVGRAVVEALHKAGYKEGLLTRSRSELDLRRQAPTEAFFREEKPEFVILAAARVGGIEANRRLPADFLYDNLAIELSVLKAAAEQESVRRVIFLGSSCIYPRQARQPMKEEALLSGPLEETNQWYAVAKIAGVKLCQAMRRQHGADFWSLMPTNLYGPGDNFDLETSHVAPALLRKFHEAKQVAAKGEADPAVTVWGTGRPRRELLYSRDLAEAIVFVLGQPEARLFEVAPEGILNVGSGQEVSIRELAEAARGVVMDQAAPGADGVVGGVETEPEEALGEAIAIEYDRSRPDGTPRKLLDTSRMECLGWQASTPLMEGLGQTYRWYCQNEEAILKREEDILHQEAILEREEEANLREEHSLQREENTREDDLKREKETALAE